MKRMFPPKAIHDPSAWDRFWTDQASHGFCVQKINDAISNVNETAALMRANNLNSILCAGSGVSGEPGALAAAGFDVTVVELSGIAIALCKRHFARQTGVKYVEGSLLDPGVAPGPFDMIIERRTLQLFSDADRPTGLGALARRLGTPGVFLSHCHDSRAPAGQGVHKARSWFETQGWPMLRKDLPVEGRSAWLITSTG
jgi:hypothetical protein